MVAPVSVEDLRVRQALPLQGEEIGGRFRVLSQTDASAPERLLALRAKLLGQGVRVGAKVSIRDDDRRHRPANGDRDPLAAGPVREGEIGIGQNGKAPSVGNLLAASCGGVRSSARLLFPLPGRLQIAFVSYTDQCYIMCIGERRVFAC